MAANKKEHPRYNIVATRLSDDELDEMKVYQIMNQESTAEFVLKAVIQRIERERSIK